MSLEFTRRSFVRGMTALFATAEAASYAEAAGAGRPHLRFGVLSDIHVAPPELVERYLQGDRKRNRPRSTELFEKAIRCFDKKGADAVVIAGDISDWGLNCQLQAVVDCWRRVFPNGRSTRDGREVVLLPVLGNHDVAFRAWSGKNYVTKALGPAKIPPEEIFKNDIPGNWRRIFGEPYEPIWRKTVKGYAFIGAHWDVDNYDTMSVPAIEPYMAKVGPSLKGKKPFFYIQHPQPLGTCLQGISWYDDGPATRALSPYPNAVAFSGHSHLPLTDERNIWQGAFTSIGTASLDSLIAVRGRENGDRAGHWNHRYGMRPQWGRNYETTETAAAHGQFVSVYDGFLEIEGFEFVSGRPLGPHHIVPVPAGGASPFCYEQRKASPERLAPFPEGASVKVSKIKGHWRLEFPAARRIEGVLAPHDYEVTAFVCEDGTERLLFRRYILRPGCFLPEDDRPSVITADFRSDLFPNEGRLRFEVRPRSVYGTLGEMLSVRGLG